MSSERRQPSTSPDLREQLAVAFAAFKCSETEKLRVELRRHRAEQLRGLLAEPDQIDLDAFNREVWVFEKSTLLGGEEIKGRLFPTSSCGA